MVCCSKRQDPKRKCRLEHTSMADSEIAHMGSRTELPLPWFQELEELSAWYCMAYDTGLIVVFPCSIPLMWDSKIRNYSTRQFLMKGY